MDTIHRQRITKNLDKLLDVTICTKQFLSLFLSRDIFCQEDVDSIYNEKTNSEQAAKFYCVIQTRTGSYEVLLEALKKYKQTGAWKILKDLPKTNPAAELVRTPRFSKMPSYLNKFLNDSRFTTLVVLSNHCLITCEQITDTLQQCQNYSLDECNRMDFSVELSSKKITALINCEDGLLPRLNYEGLKSNNLVCITSRNEEQVNQELKSLTTPSKKVLVVQGDIKWEELSPNVQKKILHEIRQVIDFEGVEVSNVLPNLNSLSILSFLQGKFPRIFNDTLQKDIKYYISRRLQSRHIVSNDIFNIEGPDIYVFKNISWYLLREKVNNKFTQLSTKILNQNTDKICHFIVLENERHLEPIQCEFSEHPVHLLRYEDNYFVWEKSFRNVKTIQKVIESQTVDQNVISENIFVREKLLQNRSSKYPILISDTPGMGKTCLIENIGRELRKKISNGLVVFIVISELIRDINKRLKTKRRSPLELKLDIWIQALYEMMSSNCLGVHYLKNRPEYLKELLLDGIDEVPIKYMTDFFKFMVEIQSIFPHTRIWITTRPHMFIEMEQRFCVLGYNIKAFEERDQINFLVHYWTDEVTESIRKFAKSCLDTVKSKLSKDEEDIAGIPLQCRLIGNVFEEKANEVIFSKQNTNTIELDWPHDSRAMFVLYEKLVEKKISIFYKKESYKSRHVEPVDVKKAHYLISISQLFSSLEKKFKQELSTNLSEIDLCNIGFLQSGTMSMIPRYIHKTFQEYFLAEFIVESFVKSYNPDTLRLFESVLDTDLTQFSINKASVNCRSFKYNVICYFVDSFMGRADRNQRLTKNCCIPSIAPLLKMLPDCTSTDDWLMRYENNIFKHRASVLRYVAEACACINLPHIFSTFLRRKSIYTDKFLIICIVKSNFYMNEIFQNYSSLSWNKIKVENYTLLHLAVIQGNCTTVEFLLENERIRKSVHDDTMYSNLVLECVSNSQNQDSNIIQEKKNILRLLFSRNRDLFKIANLSDIFHFLSIELVKEIIDIVPEFYAEDVAFLTNIIHYFSDKSNDSQLLDIIETIKRLSPNNFRTILNTFNDGSHLLETIVSNMKADTKLLEFLWDAGLSIEIHALKDSLFKLALRTRESSAFLEWLLKNLVHKSTDYEALLFKSVERFNSVAVEVILKQGRCGPNIKNNKGNTILHQLFKTNEKMNLKHYQIVSILCKNGVSISTENRDFKTPLDKLTTTHFSIYGKKIFDLLESLDDSQAINWHFLKMNWLLYNANWIDQRTFSELFTLVELEKSESILAQESNGNTLLHLAAKQGYSTAIKILLKANAVINAKNHKNETPIHLLLCGQHFSQSTWNLLIDFGADVTIFNIENMTPLCLLLRRISGTDLLLDLLGRVIHYNRSDTLKLDQILILIIWRFPLDIVKMVCKWYSTLFKFGRPINMIESSLADNPATPLDVALRNTDVSVLEYVIKTLKCEKSLLSPPNTCIHSRIQVLEFDQAKNYVSLVASLFPMLLNAKDRNGLVPLSVKYIDHDLVKHLVLLGADVNAVDNSKNTPLHWAIKHNADNVSFVTRELILAGANVNAKNDLQEAPLNLTLKIVNKVSMVKCIKLLIEGQADLKKVYRSKKNSDTFLHLLAKEKLSTVFYDVAEFLLLRGFTELFHERNSENSTAVQLALEYFPNNAKIQELFLKFL